MSEHTNQTPNPITARTAETIAAEINGIKEQVRATVVTGAIEIGRRLKEVKSLIPYGEWGAWLQTNVDYSERTAQNMMRIADEYGRTDPQALADLSLTQAVLLLGVPAEDREAFARDNDLEDMTTRELQAAIDALKADKAKMQLTIEELMQAQDKADDYKQAQQQSEARAAEAEKALEDARRQLHDAETRHAAALKAEQDKKTGAQAEKDKLAKERNEARQKLEEINRKVARLETELTEAREQVRTVETVPPSVAEELAALRRKAAQSGAETEVRTAYDVLREAYDRLTVRLADMEQEAPEQAAKYRMAFGRGLRTMAEQVEQSEEA